MSKLAERKGISLRDIIYALKLVREIRIRFLESRGDPRALRIALIYANLTDRHEARKRLSKKEMNELSEIAVAYYEQTKGRLGL